MPVWDSVWPRYFTKRTMREWLYFEPIRLYLRDYVTPLQDINNRIYITVYTDTDNTDYYRVPCNVSSVNTLLTIGIACCYCWALFVGNAWSIVIIHPHIPPLTVTITRNKLHLHPSPQLTSLNSRGMWQLGMGIFWGNTRSHNKLIHRMGDLFW